MEDAMKLARKILEHRLAMDPRAAPDGEHKCTRCHGRLRIQEKRQNRCLPTVFGEVAFQRPYGTCDRCGISYAPLDCGLGIPPTGGSVARRELICHAAGTANAFMGAAENVLKKHSRIEMSDQQVRRISEGEGQRLVTERRREVEALRKGKQIVGPEKAPDLIAVVADGGRVRTRQPDEPSGERTQGTPEKNKKRGVWKEDLVGCVYDASPRKDPDADEAEKYEGAKAGIKTFVATLSDYREFGWMLYMEALKRGYAQAKTKLFLSDGDPKLRTLREEHFPGVVFILDFYHAAGHLSESAKAAFGEGTEDCVRLYKRLKAKLWAGDLDAVIQAIKTESVRVGKPEPKEPAGSPRTILNRNIGYFEENRKGCDYPRFRAEGWPIGSGVAEGSVNQFGMRVKSVGKFWNGFNHGMGADEMLALLALLRSEDGRWDDYWRRRSQPYIREPRKKEEA
jgi:hypothetical protein